MSEQPGRYQRSTAGMIGAMLVLIVLVVGFVMLRDLNRVAPERSHDEVDYQQSVEYAREQADFRVLAPEETPEGWRATSVDFVPEPPHWHLGMLTDEEKYVGLEQGGRSPREMVTTYVDSEPTQGQDVVIDGDTWASWSDEGGDDALVRSDGDVTTLVVGTADQEVLVGYVKRLR